MSLTAPATPGGPASPSPSPGCDPGAWSDFWTAQPEAEFFPDPAALADRVLSVVGGVPMLEIGCGRGTLLRELLARGVDIRAVDVCPKAVENCEHLTPGRCTLADVRALAAPDSSVGCVLAVHSLEHLEEAQIPAALARIHRVTRGSAVIIVATSGQGPARPRTIRDRAWWEARLFEAGFRKHPACQRFAFYAALEHEPHRAEIVVEKVPAAAERDFPRSWLDTRRDLHNDMLRESGRRSDAHLARYMAACDVVRPGDTVLDAACGMGYGSHMLRVASGASRVIGVDASPDAVAYASAHYGGDMAEFVTADAAALAMLPDRSVDVVVSFETLEHVPDPPALLREFSRVLTPGGRIIVSVPNNWADESGRDPNPHHLHVYTWESLASQMNALFIPERRWRQTAGGGPTLTDRPRALAQVPFDVPADRLPEAEWWLMLAMKSPIGATKSGYRETVYPTYRDQDGFHLSNFARDYDNPWLWRSMLCMGMRMSDDAQRLRLAREVLAASRPGSADVGGAVCLLAYAALERPRPQAIDEALGLIACFDAQADDTPHAWRWRISNQYAAARLLTARGDLAAARDAFLRCGGMDVLKFSPLLATKTVDAFCRAGVIAAASGDAPAARDAFSRGVAEAQRVVSGSWLNALGRIEDPQPYGLHELSQVLDSASTCASWISMLAVMNVRPGYAWTAARRATFGETRQWIKDLTSAKAWLEGQTAAAMDLAKRREEELRRAAEWSATQEKSRVWLNEQLEYWKNLAEQRSGADLAQIERLREAAVRSQDQVAWLQSQATNYKTSLESAQANIRELKGWIEELEKAKAWNASQLAAATGRETQYKAAIDELKRWSQELAQAKAWHESQARQWRTASQERDLTIEEVSRHAAERESQAARRIAELEAQMQRQASEHAAQRDRLSAELKAAADQALGNARAIESLLARGLWQRIRNTGVDPLR